MDVGKISGNAKPECYSSKDRWLISFLEATSLNGLDYFVLNNRMHVATGIFPKIQMDKNTGVRIQDLESTCGDITCVCAMLTDLITIVSRSGFVMNSSSWFLQWVFPPCFSGGYTGLRLTSTWGFPGRETLPKLPYLRNESATCGSANALPLTPVW